MSEIWTRMMSGEPYDAGHPELLDKLQTTRKLIYEFNNLSPERNDERMAIIRRLLGGCGRNIHINSPFRCDYGCNIVVGENFFANFNLTILDENLVTIGDNAFIGPNVSIYTACHPLDATTRNKLVEWALPVTVGHNVWIGGNAVILPGVTIGDNVVVGAGAVVTRSVPSDSLVAGNPARVLRKI